jgi:GNAT superfamily N-acetyltransferase
MEKKDISSLEFHPLTLDRWDSFKELFGERGACGGCWCMWWRIKRSEFEKEKGEGNRKALRALVESGSIPGILAYDEGKPVAWCSVAPREEFPALGRSKILGPIDSRPVWSVVCFFVEKNYRNRGLTVKLLEAAIEYVKEKGGKIVEGYPIEPKRKPWPPVFSSTGLFAAFSKAGYEEVIRRSETRPIMRYYIE